MFNKIKQQLIRIIEIIVLEYRNKIRPILFHCSKNNNFHLEIHIADHCNLNCHGCSHYSPILEKRFLEIPELESDLESLGKLKESFSQIKILGGEPLLNPQISEILKIIRNYFKRQSILLVTNGLLLSSMDKYFWSSMKENDITMAITKYPGINYNKILREVKSQNIHLEIYGDRTGKQGWSNFTLKERPGNRIINFYNCKGNQFCWQLREGKIYPCPTCAYSFILNEKFGTKFQIKKGDYISLKNNPSKFQLRYFAIKPKYFCRYCKLPRTNDVWKISEKDPNEWIVKSN